MKQGSSLQSLASQVQFNSTHKQDYVVGIGAMDFGINKATQEVEYYSGVKEHGGIGGTMNNHALYQMTTAMDIPSRFVSLLKKEDPEYLPELMNRRAYNSSTQRMLRTINNRMVGAVSPSFSREYDNDTILKAVLPTLRDSELTVESCNLSETKMHLKVLSPRLKGEVAIDDIVQGGVAVLNSDVGVSRAVINELNFRLWCLNGCTRVETTNAYRRIHRGARQPEGIIYNQETTAAHQQAIALEMRDTIQFLLSEERFEQTINAIKSTKDNKMTAKNLDASVKELGKMVGFTQTEGDSILEHLIEGGDLSQFGLLQSVTRYSQDVSSYDRASEFESIGGKIIELSPKSWSIIQQAA